MDVLGCPSEEDMEFIKDSSDLEAGEAYRTTPTFEDGVPAPLFTVRL